MRLSVEFSEEVTFRLVSPLGLGTWRCRLISGEERAHLRPARVSELYLQERWLVQLGDRDAVSRSLCPHSNPVRV